MVGGVKMDLAGGRSDLAGRLFVRSKAVRKGSADGDEVKVREREVCVKVWIGV